MADLMAITRAFSGHPISLEAESRAWERLRRACAAAADVVQVEANRAAEARAGLASEAQAEEASKGQSAGGTLEAIYILHTSAHQLLSAASQIDADSVLIGTQGGSVVGERGEEMDSQH